MTARWVMIPGNEPTADGRYVGITTVTTQQWLALCRVMGRDDLATTTSSRRCSAAASAPTR